VQGFLPRYVKEVDFFTAQGLFDEAYGMADEAIERIKKYEALLEKQGKKISNGLKTALMELNLSAADAAAIGGGRLTLALRELADIPEKSRFAHDHNVAERRFNLMMTEGYYESAVALAQRQKRGAKDIGERTNWDILEERAILHNRLKDLAKEISTGMADVRAVKSFIGKAREALKLKDSVSPEEVVNEMNFLERLGRLHEHPWLNNLIGGWEGFIARLERVIGTSARSNFPQGGGDRM
jgi:hypothetical protein